VGSNLVKLYVARHGLDVVSAGLTHPPETGAARQHEIVDMLHRERVLESVREVRPDVIVHAAILNDHIRIHHDRRLAWSAYVGATATMADAANAVGAKLVLISTDWVFDGTQAGAAEATPPNPINYYGVLKLASELVALERAHDAVVTRLAAVSGVHWARPGLPRRQDPGFGYLAASIVDALEAEQPFSLWSGSTINMVATPSLASESAEMILRIVQRDLRGVFHCCGGESVDRVAFARAVAREFGLDPDLIRTSAPEPGALPAAPIPYDTSLDARATARAIEYELPSLRELLGAFRHQRETGEVAPQAMTTKGT
jgi:dTDP-4-dehydrorhamnose reductase